MSAARKLLKTVRRGAQNIAYANPIYHKILASGNAPETLLFTHPDPWPGDAQAGLKLLTGQRSMFDNPSAVSLRHAATVLRNLRAVGTDAARQTAVGLIDNWIRHYDSWHRDEWEPEILGERIAGWIGLYDFYAPAATPEFTARLTSSLYRQWKHLSHAIAPDLVGVAGLQTIRGLVYGGLNFPDGEKALSVALDFLHRQLAAEILPDGGHISRNPSAHLHVLRHLVHLRALFRAANLEQPATLGTTIVGMIPVLKFFRHAEGGLALFHGGMEETPLLIDAVVTQSETRGRILRRLPVTGYERMTAGRSLLIADVAPPAPNDYDRDAHAGLLSFEFAHGKERIIVNCGALQNTDAAWRMACAATAAHSTVTIEDTNIGEVLPEGGVLCAAHCSAQRYEENGRQILDMTHDGYRRQFNLLHHRQLSLAENGEELLGRDDLMGPQNRAFAIRWHLHPLVHVSLSQSGQTALLRTQSGQGWRLRIERGELSLDPSVYCGGGTPRRSLHLKASGITRDGQTSVTWVLAREKKG